MSSPLATRSTENFKRPITHGSINRPTILFAYQPDRDDNDHDNSSSNNADIDVADAIDNFLDTPFYNPDTVLDDESSSTFAKRFANFVKNDYYTAEGLFVGLFFVILVIVSQEILRIQLNGFENYVPFSKGTPFGRMF
jgi:hypothetical protein